MDWLKKNVKGGKIMRDGWRITTKSLWNKYPELHAVFANYNSFSAWLGYRHFTFHNEKQDIAQTIEFRKKQLQTRYASRNKVVRNDF